MKQSLVRIHQGSVALRRATRSWLRANVGNTAHPIRSTHDKRTPAQDDVVGTQQEIVTGLNFTGWRTRDNHRGRTVFHPDIRTTNHPAVPEISLAAFLLGPNTNQQLISTGSQRHSGACTDVSPTPPSLLVVGYR